MRKVVRADVPLNMVDRNQRQFQRIGQRLCPAHPRQKRTHQSRSAGDRDRIQILKRTARLGKRAIQQGIQRLHMHSGGDFRHHAAVQRVPVDLRENAV